MAGNPPHTAWDPLWRFLWDGRRHMDDQVHQLQAELDIHDQALVAYAMLRFHGLPCPAPLRSNLKPLASQGLRRWAKNIRHGHARTPAARWLFRAVRGAPMPYVERKMQKLLLRRSRRAPAVRGGGGEEEDAAQAPMFEVQYRKEGAQIISEIQPTNRAAEQQVQQAITASARDALDHKVPARDALDHKVPAREALDHKVPAREAQGDTPVTPEAAAAEAEDDEEHEEHTIYDYTGKDTCDHKCLPPLPPVFSMYAQSIQTTD